MKKADKIARAKAARAALFDEVEAAPAPAPSPKVTPVTKVRKTKVAPVRGEAEESRAAQDKPLSEMPESRWPKLEHGAFKRGDDVWYQGEHFWVESAPAHWSKGTHVRISDRPVHPDQSKPQIGGDKQLSFCVFAACLTHAPSAKTLYHKAPTMSDVTRKERAKAGVHDVGDSVAEMLRGKDLDGVYRDGAKYLGEKVQDLKDEYAKLNHGQQRMVIGVWASFRFMVFPFYRLSTALDGTRSLWPSSPPRALCTLTFLPAEEANEPRARSLAFVAGTCFTLFVVAICRLRLSPWELSRERGTPATLGYEWTTRTTPASSHFHSTCTPYHLKPPLALFRLSPRTERARALVRAPALPYTQERQNRTSSSTPLLGGTRQS